jgi:outer membrane protein insertion porin family
VEKLLRQADFKQKNSKVNRKRSIILIYALSLILAAILVFSAFPAKGQELGLVGVLPFKIHAPESLEDLRYRLQAMVIGNMIRKGYKVVGADEINKNARSMTIGFDTGELVSLGEELNVRWIIAGSATRIGEALSLDVKVCEITGDKKSHFLFVMANNLEDLPIAVEKLAAGVDMQIAELLQVDSVQVKGNRRVEKEGILAVVGTKPGERLDYARLDKDLKDVYKMGYFTDVKVETEDGPRGKIIIFSVVEKPSIAKIDFSGNKKIDKEDLQKEIGLKPYAILDESEIKRSVERLKEFYRQKAFYNAEINYLIESLPNNDTKLTYQITENEKVYIKEISFKGNNAFSSKELKKLMKTSEKGFFSWLTDSGLLDNKKLEFDVNNIAAFYNNKGYIKAVVGEPKIIHEKDKGLTINIPIQEGSQYEVSKVTIDGDLILPVDELLKKISINKEKVFNREVVRKDMMLLRDICADEGYAYAEVVPSTSENDELHLVDIRYNISKGQKVRFERIIITGNRKTRDKVIRRELKTVEGEFFSGKDLKRSTENLNRVGYFENVEVQTKKGSAEDLMILNIDVKEKPTGTFSFGAGYSSVDQLVGMVKIAQDNLFGYGQHLSASVKFGGRTNQFDLRFTEPWLFDRPIAGDVRGYKWEYEWDEYTKDSYGSDLAVGFPLSKIDSYTRGWVKYAFEDANITDVSPNAAFVIRDMEGHNITSALEFTVTRNSTDRPWNTTKGSINSVSFEYAGGFLGGDNYFNKYLGRSAWYFPLPLSTVFMAQGRAGYIEQRSGGKLPVYEKFFLGGINSVRGFKYGDISPKDPATGDKIGGEKMMVYNAEFRFPLIKDQGIIGLIFYDAGNVFTADQDFTFYDIRQSAGVGVRWYSPLGPLRLEWGYNLDRKEGEPSSNVEFSIGTSF